MPTDKELKTAFGAGLKRSLLLGKSGYDKVMNLLLLLFYASLLLIFLGDVSSVCRKPGKDVFTYVFAIPFLIIGFLFTALLWTAVHYFSKKNFKFGAAFFLIAVAFFAAALNLLLFAIGALCSSA